MAALHVAFRVGNADYAIPAAEVLHLEVCDHVTHVPGAPPYVAGLVQTRGRVVPVVDLRARFGVPGADAAGGADQRRIVVVQVGARIAGLLVDSAREVLQIDEAAFAKPPDLVEQQAGGFVKAVATVTKRMFLLVDVPRVLGEELSHGQQ